VRQSEVDPQGSASKDDLLFVQVEQRGVDSESARPFHSRLGGQVGQALEGSEKLRTTIRISRIIDAIDAREQVERPQRFRPAERQRQKDRVPCGNVSDRNSVTHRFIRAVLGDLKVRGQRAAAEWAEIDRQLNVPDDSERPSDPPRRLKLDGVPLPVENRERIEFKACLPGFGQGRRGVESSAQEYDRPGIRVVVHRFLISQRTDVERAVVLASIPHDMFA